MYTVQIVLGGCTMYSRQEQFCFVLRDRIKRKCYDHREGYNIGKYGQYGW